MYRLRRGKRFAEVTTYQVLVSEFRTECCASQSPVKITVHVYAEHVRAVIIERHGCLRTSYQLEAVVSSVPINSRLKAEPPSCGLSLNGCVSLCDALILVIEFRTVKRVGAIAFGAKSCMPAHSYAGVGIFALIENLTAVVVGIKSSRLVSAETVASGVASR